jgi:phage I-like protein
MAQSKNIMNLEDAYLLVKSHKESAKPQDLEEVKKQLRQELLKEMEQERNATQSIIAGNDGTSIVPDNTPKITDAERKVASMMKMSDSDYIKWRDMDKKKK